MFSSIKSENEIKQLFMDNGEPNRIEDENNLRLVWYFIPHSAYDNDWVAGDLTDETKVYFELTLYAKKTPNSKWKVTKDLSYRTRS